MPDLPAGIVTVHFSDIEGSIALWEGERVIIANTVDWSLSILREVVAAHGGVLLTTIESRPWLSYGMHSTCPGKIWSGFESWSWLALKMRGHWFGSP